MQPYLIDGYKFDLRVYALILSVDPLRIYMYNDGLVRLCTEHYKAPTVRNMVCETFGNAYMLIENIVHALDKLFTE